MNCKQRQKLFIVEGRTEDSLNLHQGRHTLLMSVICDFQNCNRTQRQGPELDSDCSEQVLQHLLPCYLCFPLCQPAANPKLTIK